MASVPFNNLITFSRGTNATLTGSNGLIQYAPNNLLTFSEQFDNAAWIKTNSTVTANSTVAPDGTSTADTLTAGAGAGAGQQTYQTLTNIGSNTYVYSIYAKQGSGATDSNSFAVRNQTTTTSAAVLTINYETGVITQSVGSGATAVSVGNGWWRIAIPFNLTATVGDAIRFFAGSNGAVETPGEFVFAWGAQLELGSTATTYNPTTVKNLLGFSEAFDNAAWTKTRASIVTGAQANPVNGAFNAQKLMEDTTATNSHRVNSGTVTVATNSVVTFSVYLKAAERTWCRIADGGVTSSGAYVNLATGQFGTISAGVTRSSIVPVGNGWYRASITGVLASNLSQLFIDLANGDNSITYTGDGNSGIYIYGAQLSDSASLDPYVPTPGAAPSSTAYYGPRFDYDPVTLAAKGILVEEQRVNLLLRSEQYDNATWQKSTGGVASAPSITADFGTSPDGTNNADRAQFALNGGTTSTDRSLLSQTVTIVNATSYTFSVWLRSLSGTVAMGIGCDGVAGNTPITVTSTWQRFTLTGTSTGTSGLAWLQLRGGQTPTQANAADVLVYGAQLEAGAFATSYIPTIASTVTRSADVATITGSLFSQWYAQPEGTILLNYLATADPAGTYRTQLQARNAGVTNYNQIRNANLTPTTAITNNQVIVGTTQADLTSVTLTASTAVKTTLAYKVNDFAAVTNGAAPVTDASGSVSSDLNNLIFSGGTFNVGQTWFRSINYFPTRLADFQLQALTA